MVTKNPKVTESQNELEALLIQASDDTRTKVRSNVKFIDADVVDWYKYGNDKNDGQLIQAVEVQVGDEADVRRYSIKGTEAITTCFGKPKKVGDSVRYSEVTYDDEGIPTKCKVPDIPADQNGTRWWGIQKS